MWDSVIAQYLGQLPVHILDICNFRQIRQCKESNETDANEGEIMGGHMRENKRGLGGQNQQNKKMKNRGIE